MNCVAHTSFYHEAYKWNLLYICVCLFVDGIWNFSKSFEGSHIKYSEIRKVTRQLNISTGGSNSAGKLDVEEDRHETVA